MKRLSRYKQKRKTRSYQAYLDRQWADQEAQSRFLMWLAVGTILLGVALVLWI